MGSKAQAAVGLCARAGKLVSGDSPCEHALQRGKALLVLLDGEASANTVAKYEAKCAHYGTPLYVAKGVAAAAGKPGRMVFAVTEEGFCRMIRDALASEN